MELARERTREMWPRVRSDRAVSFSPRQFPDAEHGRDPDDAVGLSKLASSSCTRCLNPYHIDLDCKVQEYYSTASKY